MTHHKLILGDCLEVMRGMPDESIDLIITDPPYGITNCEWDTPPDLKIMWLELKRIAKKDTPYVFTTSQPFTSDLICSNRINFKCEVIWLKTRPSNIFNAKKMFMKWHENIIIFYDALPTFNPQMTNGEPYIKKHYLQNRTGKTLGKTGEHDGHLTINIGKYYPKSVIEISNSNFNSLHPTEKPIVLMEYLIKTYSNEGDIILDPFAGSFTTSVAARDTGRNSIGIEINPEYLAIGKRRLGVDTPPLDGSITYEVINMAKEHLVALDEPEK